MNDCHINGPVNEPQKLFVITMGSFQFRFVVTVTILLFNSSCSCPLLLCFRESKQATFPGELFSVV